jgi:hypothetical protein
MKICNITVQQGGAGGLRLPASGHYDTGVKGLRKVPDSRVNRKDPYDVLLIQQDGNARVYQTYR